jgi:hypothetical protein
MLCASSSFAEGTIMATEMPAALGGGMAGTETDAEQARRERIETVFVVLFGTAAVLCASFLAVVTGLI